MVVDSLSLLRITNCCTVLVFWDLKVYEMTFNLMVGRLSRFREKSLVTCKRSVLYDLSHMVKGKSWRWWLCWCVSAPGKIRTIVCPHLLLLLLLTSPIDNSSHGECPPFAALIDCSLIILLGSAKPRQLCQGRVHKWHDQAAEGREGSNMLTQRGLVCVQQMLTSMV